MKDKALSKLCFYLFNVTTQIQTFSLISLTKTKKNQFFSTKDNFNNYYSSKLE